MGRKPVRKPRLDHPEQKLQWAQQLSPLYFGGALTGATMNEISRQLGVSKATLYNHFSSRKEILELVVQVKMEDVFRFKEILDDRTLPYGERYNTAVMETGSKLAGIATSFLRDLKQMHPDLWSVITSMIDAATEWLQAFYQEGINHGILFSFDPKVMALTDKIMINAFADPDFLKDNDLTLQTAIENYFSIKRNGIFKRQP